MELLGESYRFRQRIRVSVRGPGTGEGYQLLHEFQQPVQHRVPLEFSLARPMDGVRYIRVETLVADGWVVWPEVEVYPYTQRAVPWN